MSWAHGLIKLRDGSEIEVGYGVDAECDFGGCSTMIDRGLDYRCGDADFDKGCGHYHCSAHQGAHDCRYCWRCDELLLPSIVSPLEPICDACYLIEANT